MSTELPPLRDPSSMSIDCDIAKFLGHKVVGPVPVVIGGDDGRPFVADFGPGNTYQGFAYASPHWDGEDGDDVDMPKHFGVPECWLEVVPGYSADLDELVPVFKKVWDDGWRFVIQSHDSGNWTCVLHKYGRAELPTANHAVLATAVCQAVSQIKE
jgi:hypothetical protein